MSLYVADTARGGNYNESVGLDIDGDIVSEAPNGENYYDYDLLNKPNLTGVGTGLLITPENNGFPNPNDYEKIVEPDGTIRMNLKKFKNTNQSEPLEDMIDNVNNGRLKDVSVVKDNLQGKQGDVVIIKDNADNSVKGIIENTSISDIFFSDMNIKVIQDTLRYRVYENTKKVISEQSQNELFIIMRSIMLQFANFRTDVNEIVDEIKRLNKMVVDYSSENVSSNVLQYDGYIKDLTKLPTPIDRPEFSNREKNFTYDISNLL